MSVKSLRRKKTLRAYSKTYSCVSEYGVNSYADKISLTLPTISPESNSIELESTWSPIINDDDADCFLPALRIDSQVAEKLKFTFSALDSLQEHLK